MEKKKKIILFIVILASIIISVLIYPYISPLHVKEIDMYITVGNYTGFNVNTSALFFGTVVKSGSSERYFIVTNEYNKELKVKINIKGELEDWTSLSENNFMLEKNANKTVTIKVNIPTEVESGDYTSIMKIKFIK